MQDKAGRRLVIVIHDPGRPEGLDIARGIALRAGERLAKEGLSIGVEVEVISLLEQEKSTISSGDIVYGLFLARGGHWQTIEDYTTRQGAILAGKPEPSRLGALLSPMVGDCSRVSVIYWPAKRYKERHYNDTLEFARSIAGASRQLELVEARRLAEAEGCIVIAAMMPGRLIDRALQYGKNPRIPYILSSESVVDYIVNDIVAKTVKAHGRIATATS